MRFDLFFLWALLIFWIYFIGKRICFVFFVIFSASLLLCIWNERILMAVAAIMCVFSLLLTNLCLWIKWIKQKPLIWLFKRSPIGACILWLNHLTFPSYESNCKSLRADRFKCRFYCVCLVPISIWHFASNANENQKKNHLKWIRNRNDFYLGSNIKRWIWVEKKRNFKSFFLFQ